MRSVTHMHLGYPEHTLFLGPALSLYSPVRFTQTFPLFFRHSRNVWQLVYPMLVADSSFWFTDTVGASVGAARVYLSPVIDADSSPCYIVGSFGRCTLAFVAYLKQTAPLWLLVVHPSCRYIWRF